MQLPTPLHFLKRVAVQAMDDEVPELAAGLAYRFLFAIFPFGIFLAALTAFVAQWVGLGDPTDEILAALGDNLPREIAEQVAPQLEVVLGEARPALLSIGAIAALWAATGGIASLMGAMNKAYDVEETRSFFAKNALAVALTVVGSVGILAAFVTVVGGSMITEQAIQTLGVGGTTWDAIALLRWPLVLAVVTVAVASLFRFGPNVGVSYRWTLIGGAVFAVAWLIATAAFSLYVANFGNYANTYGALGGVIVLMLWFYITALLLLLAAEVTSILAKEHEPERLHARRVETAAAKEPAGSRAPTAPGAPGAPLPVRQATDGGSSRRDAPVPRAVRPGERRTSSLFALLVLGVGGLVGALAGLVAGASEEDASDA